MNIQAEKVELIRLITEINSESVLKKIRKIVAASTPTPKEDTTKSKETTAMTKRLEESKKQIATGKGVKVTLDDIWK